MGFERLKIGFPQEINLSFRLTDLINEYKDYLENWRTSRVESKITKEDIENTIEAIKVFQGCVSLTSKPSARTVRYVINMGCENVPQLTLFAEYEKFINPAFNLKAEFRPGSQTLGASYNQLYIQTNHLKSFENFIFAAVTDDLI